MELDKPKLEHLIGHWVEHNDSHTASFKEWAAKIESAGYTEIAEDIKEAAEKMDECSELLKKAKSKLD